MLPEKHRLTKKEDFSAVYSKGFYGAHDNLIIKYLPTKNPLTRIGFPVGKSFSKKAVERNRTRRILRNACFAHLKILKPGFDIVVMPKAGCKTMEFKKIESDLRSVFKKAKLLIN